MINWIIITGAIQKKHDRVGKGSAGKDNRCLLHESCRSGRMVYQGKDFQREDLCRSRLRSHEFIDSDRIADRTDNQAADRSIAYHDIAENAMIG